MPSMSLMSFLSIVTKPAVQKLTEYNRYCTPGGYDFYWRLKDAAYELTVGGKPFDVAVRPILAAKNDTHRSHNLARFEALYRWLSSAELTYFEPPHGTCSSPEGYLTVKLEPEFGIQAVTGRRLVHLWSNKTAVKALIAGAGIYLMKQHIAVGSFADCSCVILDLKRAHQFASEAPPPHVSAILASEFAWADSFFKAAAEAA